MSGTLHFFGEDVDAGGAIEVTSPAAGGVDSLLWGPGSEYGGFTSLPLGGQELGLRFSTSTPGYLVGVRWLREGAGTVPPDALNLWDPTSTSAPVWTAAAPAEWDDDSTAGWKEYRLPIGTQPALVADRQYVLSLGRRRRLVRDDDLGLRGGAPRGPADAARGRAQHRGGAPLPPRRHLRGVRDRRHHPPQPALPQLRRVGGHPPAQRGGRAHRLAQRGRRRGQLAGVERRTTSCSTTGCPSGAAPAVGWPPTPWRTPRATSSPPAPRGRHRPPRRSGRTARC